MGGTRPSPQQELVPQQESEDSDLHVHPPQEIPQSIHAPPTTCSRDDGSRSSSDSPSVGSTGSGELSHRKRTNSTGQSPYRALDPSQHSHSKGLQRPESKTQFKPPGCFSSSMSVFQIGMVTRSARQKPHTRSSDQIQDQQARSKGTARSWSLGSCVENRQSGRCSLISDPT